MSQNILILSAGTRDKLVQAFVQEWKGHGKVIATDCSNVAPAIYDADKAYIVPRISDPGYIERILEICKAEEITAVFSLIDPELSLIAKERARFEAIGVTPIVSSYELCELSLNKYRMYEYLQGCGPEAGGFKTATCYRNVTDFRQDLAAGKVFYPVFVKPQGGSASLEIHEVQDGLMLDTLMMQDEDLMIQEYMHGQEYGADVYIDMISGKVTSLFVKKKIKMRAGETDKSVSIHDEDLFRRIVSFVEHAGFRGMIDIDLFLIDNEWYLSEVNPRFGGGYPHAYACGVNFPAYVLNNLEGRENPVTIGAYEDDVYMMKYNELAIRKASELEKE